MSDLRILHNPRCSKSRQTLALLQEKGQQPEVVEYLKQPPSLNELASIVAMLGLESPRQLMRNKEAEYKDNHLDNSDLSDQQLLQALHDFPKLIERPVVIYNNQARIGRPPEQVLELF